MNDFENQLGDALREPEAPEDLARKVLAHVARQQMPRRRVSPLLRIAAAIVVIAVLAASGIRYERRRAERLAGERALAQVVEAFRLAEERLKPFRQRIESIGAAPASSSQGDKQ
jgi:hypothetical protein